MMRTNGFTLVDLAVVVVCAAVLILIPACITERIEQADSMAQLVMCQSNLNGIGKANAMFAAEDVNSRFPLLFSTGNPEADIEADHAAGDTDSLKTKLAGSEAAMQNVWVLITKGFLSEKAFMCPADKDYVAREYKDPADRRTRRVGWWSSRQFSYGMHYPYKRVVVDGKEAYNPSYLGPKLKGSFVIMADKNPSQNNEPAVGVGADKSPSNHGRFGEVYLTYAGIVDWRRGDKDSKVNGDDIYTINPENNANPSTPADMDDQYIVRHPKLPAMPAE